MRRLPLLCLSVSIAFLAISSSQASLTRNLVSRSRSNPSMIPIEWQSMFPVCQDAQNRLVTKVIEDVTLGKCQDGSWAVSEVVLRPEGRNVIITADVGQGQGNNGTVRKVEIMLTGCDITLRCLRLAKSSVKDVNCESVVLSEFDKNTCGLAKALGEWEVKTGNFSTQQGNGDMMDLCFYYDQINL